MKKIAILASGSGSNAENIITYLRNKDADVSFVVYTNNPNAFVINRAEKLQERCVVFSKNEMQNGTLQNMFCEEEFDLIVLDLMLPGIDGFEVCRQIREKKDIPVIMVSAKKDDIDKSYYIKLVDDAVDAISQHSSCFVAKIWGKRNVWR